MKKSAEKKDVAQNALRVFEEAIGDKLAPKKTTTPKKVTTTGKKAIKK